MTDSSQEMLSTAKSQCHQTLPETRLFTSLSLLEMGNTSHSSAYFTAARSESVGLNRVTLLHVMQDHMQNQQGSSADAAQITR